MIVVSALLYLGACVGHLVWMIGCHNWWYGQRLPRRAGKLIHLAHAALIVGGWAAAWWICGGPDLLLLFRWPPDAWWPPLLAAYVVSCWIAGFVWLPIVTLRRMRYHSSAIVEEQSRVIDVAKELGYMPIGRAEKRLLCRLPGNEVFRVELVERTLCVPRLPSAWDGLTILHLSDIHLSGTPDRHYFRVVMQRCREWQPDLVAFTGDLVDSLHHHGWILPVLGWLRWKVAAFAILGNHDHWYDPAGVRRRMEKLGFRVLANAWQTLELRGEPLTVIGTEYPWLRPAPDLSSCPHGPFRLCLSHSPDTIQWARQAEVDLMLAGHVHGGQIRFPLFGSMLVPSKLGRRYDCGTFSEPPTVLHVSRGLSGDWPVRYGCLPEVTLLRLKAGEKSS